MTTETHIFRLGLGGFSAEEQDRLSAGLEKASAGNWEFGKFADSDAWVLNGARVRILADSTIRVASGVPTGRSLHLNLADVDRPLGFTLPLSPRNFDPMYTFDPDSPRSMGAMLQSFEGWLRPMIAQFSLASWIIEQHSAFDPGTHHVTSNGKLIAVVDMRGEIGVLPTATADDFEYAVWHALPALDGIPEQFARTSLSRLMWQYAVRTTRDILPPRYRTAQLYFRRPPRLSQRMLTDSHLLLVRELAFAPDTFVGLQQRTGIGAAALARDLAALYFVGAITSDPRRAARLSPMRRSGEAQPSIPSQQSMMPSAFEADAARPGQRTPPAYSDLTAPVPVGSRYVPA
jgi:hypothetical protein